MRLFSLPLFVGKHIVPFLHWKEVFLYSSTRRDMHSIIKNLPKNLCYNSDSKLTNRELKHVLLFVCSHPVHSLKIQYAKFWEIASPCHLQIHCDNHAPVVYFDCPEYRSAFNIQFCGFRNRTKSGTWKWKGTLFSWHFCWTVGCLSKSRQVSKVVSSSFLKEIQNLRSVPHYCAHCTSMAPSTIKIKKGVQFTLQNFSMMHKEMLSTFSSRNLVHTLPMSTCCFLLGYSFKKIFLLLHTLILLKKYTKKIKKRQLYRIFIKEGLSVIGTFALFFWVLVEQFVNFFPKFFFDYPFLSSIGLGFVANIFLEVFFQFV